MIPFDEHGGSGRRLHFLHANGYPPDCYRPLLRLLAEQYRVVTMHMRPLWPESRPEEVESWAPLSDDLFRFLVERDDAGVICIGHSLGAIVALRAALREPHRFRAIVLIEPVLFPPYFIALWNFLRALGIGRQIHPRISPALRRRRDFDNLELVLSGYRNRQVFRYLSDENLRFYVQGITRAKPDRGFELVYSPEWEAQIYYAGVWPDMDLWRGLGKLEVPCLFIRGAESDTFWESAATLARRRQPKARFETIPSSTHLVPLERPREVFEIVNSFLEGVPA